MSPKRELMTRRRAATFAGAALLLLAPACGGEGAPATSPQVVEVEMRDIAYDPTELTADEGETVRFVFRNVGKVDHDAFIGDEAAQADHEADMGADEGAMQHDGGDDEAITVAPGEKGELTYTFDEAGTMLIGCHEPGHYAAGMKIIVTVV